MWATIHSLSSSTTDNIIQLVKKGAPLPYTPDGAVRHFFLNIRTLFYSLESSPLLSIRRGPIARVDPKLMMEQEAPQMLIPLGHSLDSAQADDVVLSNLPEERPDEEASESESEHQEAFTDAEHHAARVIQKACRRFHQRKTSQSSRPRDSVLDKLYKECVKASKTLKCSPYYMRLFRGPLPHFLVCLEAYRRDLEAKKLKLQVQMRVGEHIDIENTMQKLKAAKSVCQRRTISLTNDILGPTPNLWIMFSTKSGPHPEFISMVFRWHWPLM
jgi:hypothetical protein